MYCSSGLTSFLERVHKEKGEKSAIYISFGPVLLPKNIEMLYGVLRILKELDIPDIMAMSDAASAALPEDLKGNKNTFIRPWLPQQYILAHSVIGWFLSHCDINGTLESLCLLVPMICWPLFADKPVLSILVS
ncbi:hypothetical protein BDQ17DRAFT_1333559 [Cyathus striatus]|nr:hypothetical protein BDQ17DRAFT_1333559 [Cyathus striatus]